jgi:hypothetical protein
MRLRAGAVHIWRADLDAVGDEFEWVLDRQEIARAGRIVREPVRRRWVAARGVLRVLLGAYLDEQDPSCLRFAREAAGKPKLEFCGEPRLHFNIAHSGALAIYALTEIGQVGVDVELLAHRPNGRIHGREFLRTWVRQEAEGKLLGTGVRNRVATQSSCLRAWITELDLGKDAVGALALSTGPVDFQVYEIDFRAHRSILPTKATTTSCDERNVSQIGISQEILG